MVAEKTFDNRYVSWPGQLHGGIAFGALECACQWAFYSLKGHVGVTSRFSVNFPSRVLLNEPVSIVGKVTKSERNSVSVRGEIIQSGVVSARAQLSATRRVGE